MRTHQTTRIDRGTGVQEIAEFFTVGAVKMFGFTHLPAAPVHAGVVICSPLYAEFTRNYRREVLVGRRLAALGIAVQRFHYRGHGNSDGLNDEMNLDTMCDDAVEAAERLVQRSRVERLAFLGTRLGVFPAAAAARDYPGASLVFWDPITDPGQYLTEVFRTARIHALKSGPGVETGEEMLERFERDGAFHVLGYTIPHSLSSSGRGHVLEREVGSSPRRMFILRLGRDPRLSRVLPELADRWRDAGFGIEMRTSNKQEPWWFTNGALVAKEALTEPVDLTVD